jgi:hypothetical protein
MEDYAVELFDQLKVLVELFKAGEIDGAPRQFVLREINPEVRLGDVDEEPEDEESWRETRKLALSDSDEEEEDDEEEDEEGIKELPF